MTKKDKIKEEPKNEPLPLSLINDSSLNVEVWDIDKVWNIRWDENPRLIKEENFNNIRKSIRTVGFVVPVIYNKRTNLLVGGHQRVKAAKAEGIKQIPVVVVDMSKMKALSLSLALNKIEGSWNYGLLENVISELSSQNDDSIEFTGLSETELISILSNNETEEYDLKKEFDDFLERSIQVKSSEFVEFRCPDIHFKCTRQEFEKFINSLYAKVGLDEFQADKLFWNMIGLPY